MGRTKDSDSDINGLLVRQNGIQCGQQSVVTATCAYLWLCGCWLYSSSSSLRRLAHGWHLRMIRVRCLREILCKNFEEKIFFFFLGIHLVFYQTRTPFHFQFSLQFDASFTQARNQQHNARVSFHSGASDILWTKPWHVFALACYYFVNVLYLHRWHLSWLTSS